MHRARLRRSQTSASHAGTTRHARDCAASLRVENPAAPQPLLLAEGSALITGGAEADSPARSMPASIASIGIGVIIAEVVPASVARGAEGMLASSTLTAGA